MDNDVAVLSNDSRFTSFKFNEVNVRFKTSPRLEYYKEVVEWDAGYLVVMAKYQNNEVEEEYIDLIPILQNLYLEPNKFLEPIKKVRIEYVRENKNS